MDALTRVLLAYSTQGSWVFQEVGLAWVMQRSAASICWLARSDCPLDWGWNPEERLDVVPRAPQNARHT